MTFAPSSEISATKFLSTKETHLIQKKSNNLSATSTWRIVDVIPNVSRPIKRNFYTIKNDKGKLKARG